MSITNRSYTYIRQIKDCCSCEVLQLSPLSRAISIRTGAESTQYFTLAGCRNAHQFWTRYHRNDAGLKRLQGYITKRARSLSIVTLVHYWCTLCEYGRSPDSPLPVYTERTMHPRSKCWGSYWAGLLKTKSDRNCIEHWQKHISLKGTVGRVDYCQSSECPIRATLGCVKGHTAKQTGCGCAFLLKQVHRAAGCQTVTFGVL